MDRWSIRSRDGEGALVNDIVMTYRPWDNWWPCSLARARPSSAAPRQAYSADEDNEPKERMCTIVCVGVCVYVCVCVRMDAWMAEDWSRTGGGAILRFTTHWRQLTDGTALRRRVTADADAAAATASAAAAAALRLLTASPDSLRAPRGISSRPNMRLLPPPPPPTAKKLSRLLGEHYIRVPNLLLSYWS